MLLLFTLSGEWAVTNDLLFSKLKQNQSHSEDVLNSGSGVVCEHLRGDSKMFQPSEEEEPLSGFLHQVFRDQVRSDVMWIN